MSEKRTLPTSLAYLVSRYPAVSHTFIQREVQLLRQQGVTIAVASINPSDISLERQSLSDQTEIANCFYVKDQSFLKILSYVAKAFFFNCVGFFKGLWFAIKWAGWDLKRVIWHTFYFIEACIVGRWMKEQSLSHLHVHFANPASSVALIASKIFNTTFTMTVHGPDEFYDITLNGLKEKFEAADFIICISHYARSQVMRLISPNCWSKIEVIRLGVDPNLYSPSQKKHDQALSIICVGRLTSNKGQAILLQAFAKLIKKRTHIYLNLVGSGPDENILKYLAKDMDIENHVTFHGALNQEQTRDLLKKSDIFVLASFAEGIPVALMEAMSLEIPCISSQINGIPELITHGENGLLVSPSSIDELHDCLIYLTSNHDASRLLGQEGRLQILKHYDLTKNILLLSDFFISRVQKRH